MIFISKSQETNLSNLLSKCDNTNILKNAIHYRYGTAGFRYKAELLPHIFVKMGILACLRSAYCFSSFQNNGSKSVEKEGSVGVDGLDPPIGLMVTASHNPECDNGIKIADYETNGGMLISDKWEKYAEDLANSNNGWEGIKQIIRNIGRNENIPIVFHSDNNKTRDTSMSIKTKMTIHLGRDTRSHSGHLSNLVKLAAQYFGATALFDHGVVTTPQLHFIVMQECHKLNQQCQGSSSTTVAAGVVDQKCYVDTLYESYLYLLRTQTEQYTSSTTTEKRKERSLLVDCACGVGSILMEQLQSKISSCKDDELIRSNSLVKFNIVNNSSSASKGDNNDNVSKLNSKCGAEYVQKNQLKPLLYDSSFNESNKGYCCSLDGDADRIVFHFQDENNTFHLMDGDKIAVLIAEFIQEELSHLNRFISSHSSSSKSKSSLNWGVVQTAYANGASTYYLEHTVKAKVLIAKTGVKYVHSMAEHNFDFIGIYFEANGHGSVIFGPKFYMFMRNIEEELKLMMKKAESSSLSLLPRASVAFKRLSILPTLVNQAIGDALSDMLLVDAILFLKNWDLNMVSPLRKWQREMYTDLPSKQMKVKVKDRTMIRCNENETRVMEPAGLQQKLDSIMTQMTSTEEKGDNNLSNYGGARCFVRPSGTEDIVRIYAEASTKENAILLAEQAAKQVAVFCNGPELSNKNISLKSSL